MSCTAGSGATSGSTEWIASSGTSLDDPDFLALRGLSPSSARAGRYASAVAWMGVRGSEDSADEDDDVSEGVVSPDERWLLGDLDREGDEVAERVGDVGKEGRSEGEEDEVGTADE